MTLAELQALVGVPDLDRRARLFQGFAALYCRMLDAGLAGLEVWIDGSLLTAKPRPVDVDCVLWLPQQHIDHCTDAQYAQLLALKDRAAVRKKYVVDLYIVPPEEPANLGYWRRWFGTARDGVSPKGYAVLTL